MASSWVLSRERYKLKTSSLGQLDKKNPSKKDGAVTLYSLIPPIQHRVTAQVLFLYTNEEGPSESFFLRNIKNKLLVDHIKSTNSLFRLRGYFVTASSFLYPSYMLLMLQGTKEWTNSVHLYLEG